MTNRDPIHSLEAKQKITDAVYAVFGEGLSVTHVEEWYRILVNEANPTVYDEGYRIDTYSDQLYFRQYGEKEYSHDGSSQAWKTVCLQVISEDEYEAAKTCRCESAESGGHNYSNWQECGTERFFTYWQGRSYDYIYYAANMFGVAFVKVTIEKGY